MSTLPTFAIAYDETEHALIVLSGDHPIAPDDLTCCRDCGLVFHQAHTTGLVGCPFAWPEEPTGERCHEMRADDENVGGFVAAGLHALGS